MSDSRISGQLDMVVYPSSLTGGFDVKNPLSVASSTTSQPIPMDADGDMKIDLLGITPASKSDPKAPFQLWKNVWNASQPNSPLFRMATPAFHGPQCVLANPHSNAIVDLNGDCLADRDGTIDMVFTTCSSVSSSSGLGSECFINIAYNHQLGLCSLSTDSGYKKGARTCRPHSDLCTSDPNFKFNLTDSPDNDLFFRFPVSALFSGSGSLLVLDTTNTPSLPLPLHLGDANLDGFPDILMIVGFGGDRVPSLIYSTPCAVGVVGCWADGSGRRGWTAARSE
ncbi:hypothetical protein H0H93_006332 [Arthromyces matolae]|nr:hypothetical protein H0H93_006332 [Arthromyces matolae]